MSLQRQNLQPAEDDAEEGLLDYREDALGLVFYDDALYDGLVHSHLLLCEFRCLITMNRRFPIVAEVLEENLSLEYGYVEIGDVIV
jgi:hypothetical protein